MSAEHKGTSSGLLAKTRDLGPIITLGTAVVAAVFFFANLNGRVNNLQDKLSLEGDTTKEAVAIRELGGRLEKVEDWQTYGRDEWLEVEVGEAFREFMAIAREPGDTIGFNHSGRWGTWSEPKFCPQGEYVCGLQQKVERSQGSGDDTSMNAVAFLCCPFVPR